MRISAIHEYHNVYNPGLLDMYERLYFVLSETCLYFVYNAAINNINKDIALIQANNVETAVTSR